MKVKAGKIYISRDGSHFFVYEIKPPMYLWDKKSTTVLAKKVDEVDDESKGSFEFLENGKRHHRKRKLHRYDLVERMEDKLAYELYPEVFI